MPINPNIIAGGRRNIEAINPLDAAMLAQQIERSKQQGAIADYAMAKENKLAGILSSAYDAKTGNIDKDKYKSALAQSGMHEQFGDINKQEIEQGKEARLGAKDSIENRIKTVEYLTNQARAVKDQAGLDSLRDEAESMFPGAGARLPQQYSPEGMKSVIDTAMTQYQAMNLEFQKETDQRDFGYKVQNDDAQRAVTMRGQDMSHQVGMGNNAVIGGKNMFEAEQKLNADHQAESKNFVAVRDAYKRLMSALPDAHKSSPATLAAGTTFMKLLDPNSVVRESELAMSLNATGALDRALNYANTLANGKTLTESQVKEFNDTATKLYQAAEQQQNELNSRYTKRATEYGMNPDHVVSNYGESGQQRQAPPQQVRTQTNKKTGQRRQSTDGGMTWQIIN